MKFDARWQNFYGHDFVGAAFLPPVIRPPTLPVCGVMRAAKWPAIPRGQLSMERKVLTGTERRGK